MKKMKAQWHYKANLKARLNSTRWKKWQFSVVNRKNYNQFRKQKKF